MNCRELQREILDRLARGEAGLPAELMAHLESCAECATHHDSQQGLFTSIDQGLRAIANVAVPPSLLPAVRSRLDEQQMVRVFPFRQWTLAAFAAAAMVAAALSLLWHRPAQPGGTTRDVAGVTAPRAAAPRQDVAAVVAVPKRAETKPNAAKRSSSSKLSSTDSQEVPAPEVMVLAEEREAFSRFIAQVPENPAAAVALTRHVPESEDSVVEIALLTIKPVEVKPLEPSED